ncbi:hypothetical protein BATDEDRAFT_35032 [Batrachochytrium dendrobatidis JAM81]|uniref:Prokaryotic glutathione synthetase ATP-binding domain-containing protein n=1 Tax=Batrachochytrium dendrobatidis (strain JAM81 / FGSC 10211) TaxID=684364 RepID=F4P255_BATDJ|nr:uncharacterized protein BATDEDRAFT_35032 [Batrachochytrium dendrobatidis JAM81]EGF81057.1 hypothetical protein BATDEDRAFT_35032 [Batrachochytrium dendrobatidis JAM81]|eukprot:XP_006678594.1 hypothetical protein BATDEDRAFT_35032 [Batrachochytrium dendrobatidis JAM81]
MKYIAIPTYSSSEALPALETYSPGSSLPTLTLSEEHLEMAMYLMAKPTTPITIESPIWSDPTIDWAKYSMVLVQDARDYDRNVHAFRQWLASLTVPVFNPSSVVNWNINKNYLLELSKTVETVPTLFITRHQWESIRDQLNPHQDVGALVAQLVHQAQPDSFTCLPQDYPSAAGYVIKPSVSLNSQNTERFTATMEMQAAQAHIDAVFASKGDTETTILIQPFLKEIQLDGEVSLVFIGGVYSHSVQKTVKKGDFRVQEQWGGSCKRVTSPASVVTLAEQILTEAQKAYDPLNQVNQLLYARVDIVLIDGVKPVLMELELIEPSLYLSYDDTALEKFANAVFAFLEKQ